ncbi:SPW repeat domain-containing protein [Halosolutus gelatinilyticus]|uniref:SPW repeat domain-containing protein n=1 Tax=Halosolutus gelatinilyticus TaxID=2931975 RepID=UPI001FF6E4A7|nr:SPW repeat protein [Halosolutus gelatinilyticus]
MSDPNSDERRTETGTDGTDDRPSTDPTNDRTRVDASAEGDAINDRAEKTGETVDSGTGVGDRGDRGRDRRDESTRIANEERRRTMPFISAIIAVLGAWVALSVFVYDVSQTTLWNNVLVGAVVFLAAGYNFYRVRNDVPLSVGIAGLVALLGLWLIIAPALLAMTTGPFWSTLVTGLLIAGLAGYNAYDAREARSVATEPGTESP